MGETSAAADDNAWARLLEAEETVGQHGIVLPTALARDLLRSLNGQDTMLSPDMLKQMLADHLAKAESRGQSDQEG